jgi:hypothetical protein
MKRIGQHILSDEDFERLKPEIKVTTCCKCPKGKEYIWCGCECHKK